MDAYMRPWLLLAVLFAITSLIASQKVEKDISEPEDQEDSGSGEEEPSTCGNYTCSGNGQCTLNTHGNKSVAVCECNYGVSGRWCNDISQRSYTTYCSPNPCRIGETCKVNAYSGAAMCEPSNLHPCVPNPCLNGGKCTAPRENRFVCRCRVGHYGKWCQKPRTIGCTSATCGVHGNCVKAKCQCHYGWKGELCDVTPCIPNPCNHGTCTTIDGSFKCQCDQGYRGTLCGTRYNDRCNQNLCGIGEICTLSTTGAAMCRPSCEPNPCLNGGTCRIGRRGNGFVCRCRAGHFGPRCGTTHAIGCTPATCGVHGNCVSSKCQCHFGWKGELCDVTPCIPNPCNRGTCTTVNGSFKCLCDPGYKGTVCGIRYNDQCNPNLCRNGEICTLSTTSVAVCRSSCEPNPCLNGGTCRIDRRRGNGFVCHCYSGLSGERCETPQTIGCTPATCGVHGNCVSSTMMHCRCTDGYTGPYCTLQPDPCSPNPCKNGGSCRRLYEQERVYTCDCPFGKTGIDCQGNERSQESPCNPNPCHGGCECVPSCRHANGYYCSGTNGLLGRNCQIPAPVIVCGENAVSVSVDAAVVNEYDPGVGQFIMFIAMSHSMSHSPTCPAQNQGNSYSLVLPLPFNNCGTEVGTNADGETIVSNYVWLNRLFANGLADMPVPILHFTCKYEKQYSVITSLTPGIDIPPTIVSYGERTGSAVIDLCKSGDFCPSRCPEMYSLSRGATYTVGEELFLRITPTHEGALFRISDLFLSCSSDPATTYASSPIVLLANGCSATGSRKYLPTNVQPMAVGICASFPVPLLKSCATFYIHAKLQSCSPGVCVAAYTPCSGRLRRSYGTSEENTANPGIQVFGPIVVIKGKAGVSTKIMYPDEKYVNSTNTGVLVFKDEAMPTITGSSALLPLYVALGILLVVAVTVLGLLVGHNWRYIHAHCGRKV